MIEIWQADSAGRYGAAGFSGFGRQGTGTDAEGRFVFDTIKPGAATGRAPFLTLVVFMRGLLSHVYTRLYFSDEPAANAADPTLATVPPERRNTLVAKRDEAEPERPLSLRHPYAGRRRNRLLRPLIGTRYG